MTHLRVWHGILFGVTLGPVTNLAQVPTANYGILALECKSMAAGPLVIGSLVMFLITPATGSLHRLVNRAEDLRIL